MQNTSAEVDLLILNIYQKMRGGLQKIFISFIVSIGIFYAISTNREYLWLKYVKFWPNGSKHIAFYDRPKQPAVCDPNIEILFYNHADMSDLAQISRRTANPQSGLVVFLAFWMPWSKYGAMSSSPSAKYLRGQEIMVGADLIYKISKVAMIKQIFWEIFNSH